MLAITTENIKFFGKYMTKYVTKSAAEAPGFAYEFKSMAQRDAISDQYWWPRLLVRTCFEMAGDPRYSKLKLREHAHSFGFAGWFLRKIP